MATRFLVLLSCLLAITIPPAEAGISQGNGEIGFGFGLMDFDSNINAETGGRFDFRGGYHFTNLFQLEGQVLSANVTDFKRPGYAFQNTSMGAFLINGVFNFHPSETVVPYALGGVGRVGVLDIATTSGAGFDENAPAFQLAGGVRLFFGKSKRAAVRLELSFLREGTFDEDSTHTSLTVGFTWRLGAAK
jgi:opacity protein-like surface antigen